MLSGSLVAVGQMRVLLRDGGAGGGAYDLLLNVGMLRELGVAPGDFVECRQAAAAETETWGLARVFAKDGLQRGLGEAGRLLLLATGTSLGEAFLLRPLQAPLLPGVSVSVSWSDAGLDVAVLARQWRGLAAWRGGALLASLGGRTVAVPVVGVDPPSAAAVLVGPDTVVMRQRTVVAEASPPPPPLHQGRLLRSLAGALACSPLAARGVVVWGPPGAGKTWLLRRALAELMVAVAGGSTDALRDAFRLARAREPAVVVLDDADATLSRDSEVVAALMHELDELEDSRVAVVVALRRPDGLPAALRRAGRLEVEIEVGAMSGAERRQLLRQLCGAPKEVPDELELPGMVAGDVVAVAREARLLARMRGGGVSREDVLKASRSVHCAGSRGWEVETGSTRFEAACGMDEAKRRLTECVEWPLRHAAAFARLGVRPASGLLLYGPPGNGKTLLARAAASQLNCSFILVKVCQARAKKDGVLIASSQGPELYSKYVGESERALAGVFAQARRQHPCLVFLDEIDALAPRRGAAGGASSGGVGERMLAVLLANLDGVSPLRGVTVVGATNRPDHLDPALLRPGRLSHLLYVPLPDAAARAQLFAAALETAPNRVGADELRRFADESCEGCSGAECAAIAREAKLLALARDETPLQVTLDDLLASRAACPPRTSPEAIRFYETWRLVE